jgi:sugar lactone lactonase YvrE
METTMSTKTLKERFAALTLALALVGCAATAQRESASKEATPTAPAAAWNVTENVNSPESAYFHAETSTIFVSNVGGAPDQKDGRGWIAKLDAKGTILNPGWVTGLNAPKGMIAKGGTLWVSDIDTLVGIEIASGKIIHRVKIKGAKFLNDTAVGEDGSVYVSDMFGNAIYVVKDPSKGAKVFVKGAGFDAPNGLLAVGDRLYVGAWGKGVKPDFSTTAPGHLYWLDLKTKKMTNVTKAPLGHLDGLVQDKAGNFIVSDWMAGKVYKVAPNGAASQLFEGFKGSADLGYVPESDMLLVPRMMENVVSAYRLGS